MKKAVITSAVIAFMLMSIPAFAQSAKEAVMALKKMEARVQSGISYRDYSSALGEAKFPVNMFIESADAKKYPELAGSIQTVMKHYEYTGDIWNEKMARRPVTNMYVGMIQKGFVEINSDRGREIARLYPETLQSGQYYVMDSLFQQIWRTASNELKNATTTYAKIEENTSIDKEKKESEIDKLKKEVERLKAENADLKKQLGSTKPKRKK